VASMYGPNSVTTTVRGGARVRIETMTSYPFEETVRMSVTLLPSQEDDQRTRDAATFALHLRVPGWCKKAKFAVNGRPVPTHVNTKGFQVIDRAWQTGDRVEITLPMELEIAVSTTIQTGGAGSNHNTNRNNWVVGGLPYATVSLGEIARCHCCPCCPLLPCLKLLVKPNGCYGRDRPSALRAAPGDPGF
jgi:hypothetical protein